MSTYVDKPVSLIEKKKQQWAKEREELARLSSPWNINESQSFEAPFQRIKYVSKLATLANNEQFFRKDCTSSTRRSSLPPLYKNQYNSIDRDKEMGGETSGYGSDNPHQSIENIQSIPNSWNSGYESSSSYKDDNRPKWKDKTPGGKFWDAKENDPPNWVKRGLQRDEEIVVSNTSPAESPQQDYGLEHERPCTSSTTSHNNRSYIRGQNIPVDHAELAERERRRQIALAHQEAIRQQLEERERIKREEKAKRIKEEQEEELRIEREQEIERQRKENEFRILQEKQERERKRKEALKEALEIAEKEAKLEKMRLKNKNNAEEDTNLEKNVDKDLDKNIHNNIEKEKVENEQKQKILASPRQEIINNDLRSTEQAKASSPRPSTPNAGKISNSEKSNNSEKNNNSESIAPASLLSQFFTPRENVPIVLHASNLEALHNMQYAVLMTGMGSPGTPSIPIAIPMSMPSANNTPRTENRILTPTQYRNKTKSVCDIGTQTEDFDSNNNQRFIREKLNNLPLNYDNRNRKESKRARSEEERPKWGANRPPTRYLKQSEKDPFFQRRKPRQKRNDSSDESQTGSPRGYRKQYSDRKHTRSLWRKKEHYFTRNNVRMYQTELVPLESDKDQIYYKPTCECCCKCSKVDILRIEENNSPRKLYLPDCNDNSIENSSYLLGKEWESRTPSLSSSTRNTENL